MYSEENKVKKGKKNSTQNYKRCKLKLNFKRSSCILMKWDVCMEFKDMMNKLKVAHCKTYFLEEI